MKQIIDKLNNRIAEMQTEIEDNTKAILAIQKICDHDYKHIGYHEQKRIERFECANCGKEETRDV